MKVYVDLGLYFQIMDSKPTLKDPTNPTIIDKIEGSLHFNNVSFRYEKTKEVIQNFELNVAPKQTIALVGISGGGKTTLTKLLLRFYDPDLGSISIDGINIKNFSQKYLRENIGLVPQDPILFNDTIKFNISYAKSNATSEEIIAAAQKANLHDFIDSLPNKYDTIVGERGIKLSGGQRQRLAIARILLKNPPIIIFDEATSQLDSENEKRIHEAFLTLSSDKTTIIIAHRLSTVMHAEKIVVLDQGKTIETGKHKDLINQNGIYAKLWKLQTEKINTY